MHSTKQQQQWGTNKPRYGDVPPNQTLYLNNLNEKISVAELKCCLLELFSTYGEVIDVIAQKASNKRGQAFIVFRDISCATNALRALQGFTLLDKQIRVAYCKTKSDVVAHEDGTWKPRAKAGAAPPEKEEKGKKPAAGLKDRAGMKGGAASGTPPPTPGSTPRGGAAPPAAPQAPKPAAAAAPAKAAATPAEADAAQPSNVLFVENLPAEVNEMMLTMLFRQYPGFQEARLIKGRNVAFIEYGDELQAGIAKHGLQGFMVTPDMALKIAFAKQ